MITFLGVTRSDDTLASSSGTTPEGWPIYTRATSLGFSLVVEGRPGASGAAVGRSAFDPVSFPDLQVQVRRPLGNGSAEVCDRSGQSAGGVPAIDPPSFEPTETNIAVVNDLACRFLDGSGAPGPRDIRDDPCILFETGNFGFADPTSTLQYCGFISRALEFPPGDTRVTVRLRDTEGNVGEPRQLVISIVP